MTYIIELSPKRFIHEMNEDERPVVLRVLARILRGDLQFWLSNFDVMEGMAVDTTEIIESAAKDLKEIRALAHQLGVRVCGCESNDDNNPEETALSSG